MVDARGDLPERRFQLTLAGGRVEITELDETESEPDARDHRPRVGLGARARPGERDRATCRSPAAQPLAEAVLDGFAHAGARRAAAAA